MAKREKNYFICAGVTGVCRGVFKVSSFVGNVSKGWVNRRGAFNRLHETLKM